MKLTGCLESEFTCDDGQCVSMGDRCNQIVDCRDNSDEKDCSLLVKEESYNKKVAPFSVSVLDSKPQVVQANINVSITVMNIIEIREVDHIITLKFSIILEWYEHRAVYHNLKKQVSLNSFSDAETDQIWVPYVIYKNTDNNDAVTVGDTKTTVAITREGGFTRSTMDVADEIEIFLGSENRLTLNQSYTKEFHCTYQLHWFPFDTQVTNLTVL